MTFFSPLGGLKGDCQNNALVLNSAYLILDGGVQTVPVYVVVNQPALSGIVRLSGGHIRSEGQYNFVKWNSGTNTGNYVFPFGMGGTAADYIPFTFNKTTAGGSDISMSTWTSNPSNVPWAGVSNTAAVANMFINNNGIDLSVPSVIDRWWDIQSSAPVTADLTFSYRGAENTTAVPTDTFKTQHWNGAAWDPQAGPGNPGITTGIGTVGPITGQTAFSPWVLTRAGLNAIITASQNLQCNSQCTGSAWVSAQGGTAPYTYLWSPASQNAQTATGLCAGIYSVTVIDAAGSAATDTVLITQPAAVSFSTTASPAVITAGNNTTLTASGGGTYLWLPAQWLSNPNISNPVATPSVTTTYCVLVTDTDNCSDTACVIITVNESPCKNGALFVPNAFTPNGDNENEQLCVYGNCIKEIYFIIYNRWGEKVFETTDIGKCWDGTPQGTHSGKGEPLNTAVFVYYLRVLLIDASKIENKIEMKGNVSLIR